MLTITGICLVVAVFAYLVCCQSASVEPAAGKKAPSPEEMMAACAARAVPGPEHKALEQMAGDFDAEMTMYMPGSPPHTSRGIMRNRMILGGRWLHSDYEADGQPPFQGLSLFGFDNIRRKFICTWTDTMSTGLSISEGTADAALKQFTLDFTAPDPMTGARYRQVTTVIDHNRHDFEMFTIGNDGKLTLVMKIHYKRR